MRIWMVLALFLLIPSSALGGISGSAHDFSSAGWNSTGEICVVCHTPHDADTSVATDVPLWNHQLTTTIFKLYSSPTLQQSPAQPQGISKICLSCHDGVVALDAFSGMNGSTLITGPARIGTDLSDDHPISIQWDHQTGGNCSNCHRMHGPFDRPLPFFDGAVECGTCHDVHNQGGNVKLLRMHPSEICLQCHGI